MNAEEQRRSVQEKTGVAVNSSHLEQQPGREMPVDLVGALGAAALHIHHGADRQREPVAMVIARRAHHVDPQDVIVAQLAPLLIHIRAGGHQSQIPRAIRLFARWMQFRGRFSAIEDADRLLPRLAERALHEYLSDRCPRCGGTGMLEVSASGLLVRGSGRRARNAVFRNCPIHQGCGGSGRPTPSHTARRLALGLTPERYDAEGWGANVRAAIAWLDKMQGRIRRPLTVQLKEDTKRG